MRILDYANNRSLKDVSLMLTPDEVKDLASYLNQLTARPAIGRVYLSELSGNSIEREITVSLTDYISC
jgi:hypothetical protein